MKGRLRKAQFALTVKYLDQAEVDAIAKARLQPTLDDIADKAEKQRAKEEEERLERERLAAQAARYKAREAEITAQTKAATGKWSKIVGEGTKLTVFIR